MNITEPTGAQAIPEAVVSGGESIMLSKMDHDTLGQMSEISWPKHAIRDGLIFTAGSIVYLLPFMRVLLNTDEGLLTYGATRVSQGQVFGRDFFEIVGPGTFYWVALFFKVLGGTFFAARTCLFLTSLTSALLIYALSRRICDRHQLLPCVVIAGASFGAIWPTISHHVDSNCAALLSVYFVTLWLDNSKPKFLWAAGVAAGATAWFHLPKGVLLLSALLVWALLRRHSRSTWWRNILPVVGGFSVFAGCVLLYFARQRALGDMFNATLIWPSQHYGAVNALPYAHGIVSQYWDLWAVSTTGLQWTKILASILIVPLLFIALLPLVLPLLGLADRRSFIRPEISLLWLCGCAMWYSEFHRKDICHLVFGSPLLVILAVYYLQRSRNWWRDVGLQILLVSASCLALANLALVGVAHVTQTRVGRVWLFKPDNVLAQMQQRIPVGEEILVYPSNPEYYFLTQTRNPIRFGGLMYNYNKRADFEDVVDILEQHKVKHVVWDTEFMDRNLKAIFPSATPATSAQLVVEPYLEAHYTIVWEEAGVKIMERRGDSNATK